jgi:hypothetical protein
MVPSGIFIRTGFDGLAEQLIQRLIAQGPANLKIESPGGKEPTDGRVRVRISKWSEVWCRIEVEGVQEGIDLVLQILVAHDPFDEVLTIHFKPGVEEYSYILYRNGQMMEKFASSGPGIESIHFVSELRRVPLQSLMSAARFMTAAMGEYGVHPNERVEGEAETALIDLVLPGKPTFLQSLLGAASIRR